MNKDSIRITTIYFNLLKLLERATCHAEISFIYLFLVWFSELKTVFQAVYNIFCSVSSCWCALQSKTGAFFLLLLPRTESPKKESQHSKNNLYIKYLHKRLEQTITGEAYRSVKLCVTLCKDDRPSRSAKRERFKTEDCTRHASTIAVIKAAGDTKL